MVHSFSVTFLPLGFRLFLFQLQINKQKKMENCRNGKLWIFFVQRIFFSTMEHTTITRLRTWDDVDEAISKCRLSSDQRLLQSLQNTLLSVARACPCVGFVTLSTETDQFQLQAPNMVCVFTKLWITAKITTQTHRAVFAGAMTSTYSCSLLPAATQFASHVQPPGSASSKSSCAKAASFLKEILSGRNS